MTLPVHVEKWLRERKRNQYQRWLNSWRGKWWRFRQGHKDWWKTKSHAVLFKDEPTPTPTPERER